MSGEPFKTDKGTWPSLKRSGHPFLFECNSRIFFGEAFGYLKIYTKNVCLATHYLW
ncbi:MAG: hypothetical protein PPFGHCPK_01112 [Spiroplasma endosymbiont of Drosophila atripex]|nr:MAG: hypothetical protein PPFGHCPK_01112 [Spiroplasma endosymbiont of Drosophila atripex]